MAEETIYEKDGVKVVQSGETYIATVVENGMQVAKLVVGSKIPDVVLEVILGDRNPVREQQVQYAPIPPAPQPRTVEDDIAFVKAEREKLGPIPEGSKPFTPAESVDATPPSGEATAADVDPPASPAAEETPA